MKNHRKEIIYPIFLKISRILTDTFWVYLFEDLAYGICPFGTYIENDAITCNFKGKQFRYSFIDKTENEIRDELIVIFTTKLNIYSKIDYLKNRTNFGKGLQPSYGCWKDIKKKSIKDILIENFVLSLKDKYNLTAIRTRKILSIIHMAFTFKLISNNNIIYDAEECKIKDITGLNFDHLSTHSPASVSSLYTVLSSTLSSSLTSCFSSSITTNISPKEDESKLELKEIWQRMIETI